MVIDTAVLETGKPYQVSVSHDSAFEPIFSVGNKEGIYQSIYCVTEIRFTAMYRPRDGTAAGMSESRGGQNITETDRTEPNRFNRKSRLIRLTVNFAVKFFEIFFNRILFRF